MIKASSLPSPLRFLDDSPNAEEALSLLSVKGPPSKQLVEQVAARFLEYGVGREGKGAVVIRSGEMGAFVRTRGGAGKWVSAFWTEEHTDKVVDVTGAGNAFLGGFAAGLQLSEGDIYQAALYGSISASFIIEQAGLPLCTKDGDGKLLWNGESPQKRLLALQARQSGI